MSWKKVKLGEFLTVRKDRFKPLDPAIASLKRIEKIDFSGQILLSNKSSNTDMILIKKGDLVISGINVEKGAMAVYQQEADITATIHYSSYQFDERKINIEFLKHFLRSSEFRQALKEQVPGGIKTEIKPKHLLPLVVNIPSDIADQEAVVQKLHAQNSKITLLSTELAHQLSLVQQLRRQILQEAVQGKLLPQDPRDEPAAQLLQKIKAEKEALIKAKKLKKSKPLPPVSAEEVPFEIPKGWVWCRLGEVSVNRDGDRKPISQLEREKREKIYDYYGASGVIDKIDGFTHEGELLLIGEDGANLVSRSTPIAFIAKGKFWVNNHAHVIEALHQTTTSFLCFYINALDLTTYITGGFQPKLSQSNLNIITIPLPPLPEQQRIVQHIEALMKACDALEASILHSRHCNEQLLQQVLREALQPV